MRDEIDPVKTFNHLLTSWWKIVLIAVLGGLIGLGISYLQPPTYQAEAVFHASIDFTQINYEDMVGEYGDPLVWTQYEEDLALQIVERMLIKQTNNAFQFAKKLDPSLDIDTFRDNRQIERYLAKWFLRYRHPDPEVAQAIVNHWAEVGIQALHDAQSAGEAESFVIADLTQTAPLPSSPIYHNRNILVLTGTFAGLVTGIIAIDFLGRYRHRTSKEV